MSDVLHALGPQAGLVIDLWRFTLGLCTVVFVALLAVLGVSLARAPRAVRAAPHTGRVGAQRQRLHARLVAAATAAAVLGLFALIGASLATDRALAGLPLRGALQVEVTAHQWWWELRYDDADGRKVFTTANELHLPVGRPVQLTLQSADVIHSLWLPSLAGKKDLVPGRPSSLLLQVDRPSVHRGPCAEFCGAQHAQMALLVVAEPPAQFEAWAAGQRRSAAAPADALHARGRAIVTEGACALCHGLAGTPASGRTAPDLTHLASRRQLAAGALPNTPETLARWIADPQRFKPGTTMPAYPLPADDLRAVVAYLGSLQ